MCVCVFVCVFVCEVNAVFLLLWCRAVLPRCRSTDLYQAPVTRPRNGLLKESEPAVGI